MRKHRFPVHLLLLVLLALASGTLLASASSDSQGAGRWNHGLRLGSEGNVSPRSQASWTSQPIIVDHTATDITTIPQQWIDQARATLHIGYGHTSHGSQITTGMTGLVGFANGGGLGLSLPHDAFAWNYGGTGGALDLREGDGYGTGDMDHDAGYWPNWLDETEEYLGPPDPVTGRGTTNPEINVIMWAWCGQVSGYTAQMMLDRYLLPMTQLELDYPGIAFVYMTGHADGSGELGNLHMRNQQIRDYCIQNNKVLYDFYDIECYDPGGSYYGDKAVNDNCDYDSDGNGSRDSNWATSWQGSHTVGADWYSCGCAHSQALNCNQKAYAIWWLWARLAGWGSPPGGSSYKAASAASAVRAQTVTYTLAIRELDAPLGATTFLTDTIPSGLSYITDSLVASTGVVNDDSAPTLTWTGVLTPSPVVTVSYATTVTATGPQTITNTALIAVPGYQTITRTATVRANWHQVYLPLAIRRH